MVEEVDMRAVAKGFALVVLMTMPAWPQAKPQTSKLHAVLDQYAEFLSVDQKLEQLQSRSDELDKEMGAFFESESALNRLSGLAMYVGALKAWIPEIKDYLAEEDSQITKLVTLSTGLGGDAGRYADEGVRLLRERHVYLRQQLDLLDGLAKDMVSTLRGIREDRISDLPELLNGEEFSAKLKTTEELERKEQLVLAQAKDAFSRLKAASK
jgi:hypothetical protein